MLGPTLLVDGPVVGLGVLQPEHVAIRCQVQYGEKYRATDASKEKNPSEP